MNKLFAILSFVVTMSSCEYFKQDLQEIPIARVNQSYLFKKDLKDLIFENTTKEDSAAIVTNFINRWATQQLLIDQSIINLPETQQAKFDKLVEEYKVDLYTEAYKSAIITKQLNSAISEEELVRYYNLNKGIFKLNDELVKVRYVQVDENYSNLKELTKKFERFKNKDKEELTALSIKFKSYNLNDSIWIKRSALIGVLPIVNQKESQVLKKAKFTKLQDSLGVYLVKIEAILNINDTAPFSYVKPTIEQIVLNKRKKELLKKLERDITKDAIKNKNFELFTNK